MGVPLPSTLAHLTDQAFTEVLFGEGASSRARVAKLTGISKPTISESAQRLLGAGVIVEVGLSAGNLGRPTVLYDVNPQHGHALGVALERGHTAVRALDYRGGLIAEYRSDADDDDMPSAVARARILIAKCAKEAGSPRLATALSVAAPVDPASSTARLLPGAPLHGTVGEFGPALGLSYAEPLRVDNDVNWATVAESRFGSMQQATDFLYVYLGAGVGSGLFLSGHLHRGSAGLAGEIAFTRADSGETLMHRLGQSAIGAADGRSVDLDRASGLLNSRPLSPAVETIVADLARAIVNAATVIDPGRVVLGGPLSETRVVASDLTDRISAAALTHLDVRVSPLGRDAPLLGAGIGALELAQGSRTYRSSSGNKPK